MSELPLQHWLLYGYTVLSRVREVNPQFSVPTLRASKE